MPHRHQGCRLHTKVTSTLPLSLRSPGRDVSVQEHAPHLPLQLISNISGALLNKDTFPGRVREEHLTGWDWEGGREEENEGEEELREGGRR